MGKASSSKKVARAARAGGRTSSGPKRHLGYPLAIGAIVVVGVLLVLVARSENQEAAAATPVANVDHWHAAYGVYVCDTWLPPLTDQVQDVTGLHTHGDGIAHIHPFNTGAAGNNATVGKWGETTGIDFGSDSFTVNGTSYANGYDCNGQPANVSLYVWNVDEPDAEPKIYTKDFGSVHFDRDRLAMTFAVVPDGTEVPKPESLGDLDKLDPATDAIVEPAPTTVPGATSDTTVVEATSTTVAGEQ